MTTVMWTDYIYTPRKIGDRGMTSCADCIRSEEIVIVSER